MPVTVYWYVPDKVIYVQMIGDLGVKDAKEFNQLMLDMMNTSPEQAICFLYDGTQVNKLPGLTILKEFTYPKHPKASYAAVFGFSSALQFVAQVSSRFFRTTVQFTRSHADGVTYLRHHLPDLEMVDIETLNPYASVEDVG